MTNDRKVLTPVLRQRKEVPWIAALHISLWLLRTPHSPYTNILLSRCSVGTNVDSVNRVITVIRDKRVGWHRPEVAWGE